MDGGDSESNCVRGSGSGNSSNRGVYHGDVDSLFTDLEEGATSCLRVGVAVGTVFAVELV